MRFAFAPASGDLMLPMIKTQIRMETSNSGRAPMGFSAVSLMGAIFAVFSVHLAAPSPAPADSGAGKICVVCRMAQSGESEIRKLEGVYQDISEILQHLEGGEEKIKSLRLALDSAREQSVALQRLCSRDKDKLLNKLKSNDQIPTCKAYLETAGVEVELERRHNAVALPYVQTRLAEARAQERTLAEKLLRQPGMSAATLNDHPQVKSYKQIIQKLVSELDGLERDRRHLTETASDKPASDVTVDTALEKMKRAYGLDPNNALMHCWAIHDAETAREAGCAVAK